MQELAKLSSAGSDVDESGAQSSGAVDEGDEVAGIQMEARWERESFERVASLVKPRQWEWSCDNSSV